MCCEEREAIEHMWRGCGEMRERERERKERGEILSRRKRIGWMKEIWKRRETIEKKRGENRKKNVISFFGIVTFIFK
jgi:hypothetical protein